MRNPKTTTSTAQSIRLEKTPSERRAEVRASRAELLARLLAGRLAAHADCESHTENTADPDNCPFCADRAAYAAWLEAGGEDFRDRRQGRTIAIEDLWARPLTGTHGEES